MTPSIETIILGSLLDSRDPKYLKLVDAEYFTDSVLREAVRFCKEKDTLDIYLLDNHLSKLDDYRGIDYVNSFSKVHINSDQFESYLKALKSNYFEASLANKLLSATSGKTDLETALTFLKKSITSIESELSLNGDANSYKISENNGPVLDKILEIAELDGAYSGIPSGIKGLDNMLSGFQKTDLVIVGARPGVGKSSLITTIAQNIHNIRPETVTVIFSLEMSKEQIIQRMLSGIGRVPLQKIRSSKLNLNEWARLLYAKSVLDKCNLYIDDKGGITIDHVYEVLREIKSKTGKIDLVFIDYLQLMRTKIDYTSTVTKITEISSSCKTLAKDFNVPVIALSQLSRSSEQRTNKRPQDSDLRESGAIEQDADVIMFIYRDYKYNPTPDNEYLAELIVSKHRNGPTGTIHLAYLQEFTRFENIISK